MQPGQVSELETLNYHNILQDQVQQKQAHKNFTNKL